MSFIESIKRIEKLAPNWDSYQGHPLDISVEQPALELAIMSNELSNYPSVYALPTGGLSLRWVSSIAELEIDISPNATCEALLELHQQGEEIELPRRSSLADAKALLVRFKKAG